MARRPVTADAGLQACDQVFHLHGCAHPVRRDEQVEVDPAPWARLQPDLRLRAGQLELPGQRMLEVALGMKDRPAFRQNRQSTLHVHVHPDPEPFPNART